MSLPKAPDKLSDKKMALYAEAVEPGFYKTWAEHGERRLWKNPAAFGVYAVERVGDNIRIVYTAALGDTCIVLPIPTEQPKGTEQ